jgi:hypothetical protein
MRLATRGVVCLTGVNATRLAARCTSTVSFDRLLPALSAICRCPSSKSRSWRRNRQESGECRLKNIEGLRNHVALAGDIASTEAKALQTVNSVKSARQWYCIYKWIYRWYLPSTVLKINDGHREFGPPV